MNLRSDLLNPGRRGVAIAAIFLAATLVATLPATTATADVTFAVTGEILTGANAGNTDTSLASAGDQVQVDIFMLNTSYIRGAAFAAGIGRAFNSGTDGLVFDGGSVAATWLNTGVSKFGAPIGGVPNNDGTSNGTDGAYTSIEIPKSLDNSNITISNNIRFFNSFLIDGLGDGAFDMGILDGSTGPGGTPNIGLGGAGASHARLLFTVIGAGALLGIGDNDPDDALTTDPSEVPAGVIFPASIQVPEPSGVALGLSAMASVFTVVGIRRRTG
jgi:hypothetical protein